MLRSFLLKRKKSSNKKYLNTSIGIQGLAMNYLLKMIDIFAEIIYTFYQSLYT